MKMVKSNENERVSSLCSFFSTKRSSSQSSMSSDSSLQKKLLDEECLVESELETPQRKPGWKAMPYILGNETMERMATYGLTANFMVYLMREYNMDQVLAANILNTWTAVCNVTPVIGAYIADAYLGKFRTIAAASFASLVGMLIMTRTAWVPQFHPSPCPVQKQLLGQCIGHTTFQMGVLLAGLCWLGMGSGGIRPCSVPFAIDQFDLTTVEGRKGIKSFFNWYYTSQTVIMLINQTLVVYIQDSVSWTLGFGLPSLLMFLAIILFFSGTKIYAFVKPEGSIFASIAQVLVAAKHKCHLDLPAAEDSNGAFYDPPFVRDMESKLPLTKQFRCLNKAAIVADNEFTDESSRDPWRLCSIQQVEEFKCLLKIIPIWIASIICYLPLAQQGTFPISQALKMDRHLTPNFEMPAGSITVFTLLTIAIFLPFYDQVLAPALAKITKQEEGITALQRIGIGHVFAILTMVVAGWVERKRRALAISYGASDGVAPMSVMWLAPQFIILAISEVSNIVGHTEFYNQESPGHMRSLSNSLLSLTASAACYLSSLLVSIVHNFTANQGQPDWLTDDINKGRLDYYYFIIAGLGALNFSFYIFCARRYSYKITVKA